MTGGLLASTCLWSGTSACQHKVKPIRHLVPVRVNRLLTISLYHGPKAKGGVGKLVWGPRPHRHRLWC
jgi:hypothetical protein